MTQNTLSKLQSLYSMLKDEALAWSSLDDSSGTTKQLKGLSLESIGMGFLADTGSEEEKKVARADSVWTWRGRLRGNTLRPRSIRSYAPI